VACIATLIEPQWFERLFSKAPDGSDSSLETVISVAVSSAAYAFFSLLAGASGGGVGAKRGPGGDREGPRMTFRHAAASLAWLALFALIVLLGLVG
jgi:hypothetical protein